VSDRGIIIVGVSPARTAQDPKHPDHARWVKDHTLKMEAEHAQKTGQVFRNAETANLRNLERLDGRKRVRPSQPRRPKKSAGERREERAKQLRDQGVFVNPVAKVIPAAAASCNKCGQCERCRREARLIAIAAKAREGDLAMMFLMDQCTALVLASQKRIDAKIAPTINSPRRVVPFSLLGTRERNRLFVSALNAICNWSVRSLGAWK
jgi:hypothetical protein